MDLSRWNFTEQGPTDLEADWQFCWQALLEPGDADCPNGWEALPVPGLWSQIDHPREGVGTYRLSVILPDTEQPLALRAFAPYSAHRLWLNGVEYPGSGYVTENVTTSSSFRGWRSRKRGGQDRRADARLRRGDSDQRKRP